MNKTIIGMLLLALLFVGAYMLFGNLSEKEIPEEKTSMNDDVAMHEENEPVTNKEKEEAPKNEEGMIYGINQEKSVLAWEAGRLVGKPHTGQVALSEGTLRTQDDMIVGGEFVINMADITEDNGNERFLGHVSSEDFFAVETYPKSRFVLQSVAREDDTSTFVATGDLTIRDQTHEITFPFTSTVNDGTLQVQADFDIDRTRWGITYDSGNFFQQLGEKAIKDDIQYSLDLVFDVSS